MKDYNKKKLIIVSMSVLLGILLLGAGLLLGARIGGKGDGEQPVNQQIPQSAFLYEDYTGYLDESYEWAGYENFIAQDYDGDGVSDRVYREYRTNEAGQPVCDYLITLGNGECIQITGADTVGTPEFVSFDMTGDGQPEILFRQTYEMSTDPRSGGAFILYEADRDAGGYQPVQLPFISDTDGSNTVELLTTQDNQSYTFQIPSLDFAHTIYVPDYEFWEAYGDAYSKEAQEVLVWYAEPVELQGSVGLKCSIHLFDKWSSYGVQVTVSYENGAYVAKDVQFMEDERFAHNAENISEEYAVYRELLNKLEAHLLTPYEECIVSDGQVYMGLYDYGMDGVKELIFGDVNGINIYTCQDGAAVKIKELYLPEECGGMDELYFYNGTLMLAGSESENAVYLCWNGTETGYYSEAEYPWGYIDDKKTPYNVFLQTFSVDWVSENRKPLPTIRIGSGEGCVELEKFF